MRRLSAQTLQILLFEPVVLDRVASGHCPTADPMHRAASLFQGCSRLGGIVDRTTGVIRTVRFVRHLDDLAGQATAPA